MRVLYAGDEKLETPQFFAGAESFQVYNKVINDYEPLLSALEDLPDVNPTHLGSRAAVDDFPDTVDELAEYDAVILSDLSRGTLQPHFRDWAIPGPNRLRALAEWVREGGALLYCGGWMTFQGYRGAGNWAGTPVADILPVTVRPVFDDRVERPEGVSARKTADSHPIIEDLPEAPTVYGYNRVGAVDAGATELLSVDGDPLLAAGSAGDGRVVAYTSDPNVMWGVDFIERDDYGEFWGRCLDWAITHE